MRLQLKTLLDLVYSRNICTVETKCRIFSVYKSEGIKLFGFDEYNWIRKIKIKQYDENTSEEVKFDANTNSA